MMERFIRFGLVAAGVAMAGCGENSGQPSEPAAAGKAKSPDVVRLKPSADSQMEVQRALIAAKPGTVIEFDEGVFEFTMGLSLSAPKVTLRGKGHEKTIFSFKNQNAGKDGLSCTGDGLIIEDLAIEDTKGDAIKVNGVQRAFFRGVRTEWTGGPKETNGAYGLYPVQCTDVLIDRCIAKGASDAGIYVGQSRNIIVRRCRAEGNVAGIEIENSENADVYENVATGNTGGILVFDMPNLPKKNGGRVRVFNNKVTANNLDNFAPKGNIVASVPPGTGVMVMAADNVEIFDNDIEDHRTCSVSIISFLFTQKPFNDPEYDPFPEKVHIHGNRIRGGGGQPAGAVGALLKPLLGTPIPDIVYDGILDPKKAVDGKLPGDLALALGDNGGATFANLQFDKIDVAKILLGGAKPDRNAGAFKGSHPRLSAVVIEGCD